MNIDGYQINLNLEGLEGVSTTSQSAEEDLFVSILNFKKEFKAFPTMGVSLYLLNIIVIIEKIVFDDIRKIIDYTIIRKV